MRWIGTGNIGMMLLGIWLIISGLLPFVDMHLANVGSILSILAIAAGTLILLGR